MFYRTLTREAIQQSRPFEKVEVDVSELGNVDPATGERERTTVFVRELSVREKSEFEMILNGKRKHDKNFRSQLLIAACCDADGFPIFRPEDAKYINQQPLKVIERICDAARKINDMLLEHERDVDEEEQVKN